MGKKAALVGIALAAWLLPDEGFGQMRKGSWEIAAYSGQAVFASELELDNGELGGVRVAYNLNEYLGVEVSVDRTTSAVEREGGTLLTGSFPLGANEIGMEVLTYKGDLIINGRSELRRWRGYGAVGLGRVEFNPRGTLPPSLEPANTSSLLFDIGGGARYFLRDWIALRGDVRVEYATGDTFTNGEITAGVSFHFGGHAPRDMDEDGVSDVKDICADTPVGATVDPKGCPSDTDGDRALDGLDRCPGTPEKWPVDETGCPTDVDGDGVPDGADECGETPEGARVDERGCPIDSDGDGIFDGLDQCPGTPAGAVVDDRGCPVDSDGDGIFDGLDQCPGSAPGTNVDETGCPRIRPAVGEKLILEGVTFASGRDVLEEESYPILEEVLITLTYFQDWTFEIQGHTDSDGTVEGNQVLSERRAETVRRWFLERGIAPDRLTARGYGESSPLTDNLTEIGKARNRRVELLRIR